MFKLSNIFNNNYITTFHVPAKEKLITTITNAGSEKTPEISIQEIKEARRKQSTREMLKFREEGKTKDFRNSVLQTLGRKLHANRLVDVKGDTSNIESYRPVSLLSHFI